MKVVGRTDAGYLVEITEHEIGICTGFGESPNYGHRSAEFDAKTNRVGRSRGDIPTGTKIDIVSVHRYLKNLMEKTKKAKECAEALREIANMITIGLPDVVIPPTDGSILKGEK